MGANNQAAGAMIAALKGAPEDQNGLREALARDYVIIKRGLYYRPDNMGYTGVLDDAGRYTAEDVKRHHDWGIEVKGVLASEAPRFSPACWPETVNSTLMNDLLAAEAEITRLKEGMEARWRSMDTAPNGVPIYAKHQPNEHTPHGWIALIRRRAEDPDEGRGCGRDTILHYNGDASMRGFHGCWTGWLWPEELATLSPKEHPHG